VLRVLSSTAVCLQLPGRTSLQQVLFSSPALSPYSGAATFSHHPGATSPRYGATGGAVLSLCPPPMISPSKDMTRSSLLAGSECPQRGPGCRTGVWELCWEARTSPGTVRIAKASAGPNSRPCVQAGRVVGCRQGVTSTRGGGSRERFSPS